VNATEAPPSAHARALARLYDVDLADDPGDLDLYLALARRTGGPLLELAAGTGRLAVPLAAAGFEVTAVDLDPAMLERARDRAAAAGDPARGRLTFVEADLLDLELPAGDGFRLAFIGLNSHFLLATRDAQRNAFRTLARHLVPGGVAVVDVWLPDADDLARFDGRLVLEYERLDPESGLVVLKTAAARHDAATGTVELTTIFDEGAAGAAPARWTRRDALRLVSPDELRDFAEGAGLVVESLAGGYDLEDLGPGSERAILIARRPSG
jgi:SAM-dependent methyltransferase